jgi:Cyclic nucleotide-binding domain
MAQSLDDDLSGASFSWGRPNERTPFVDAALVRVCRALDAVAAAQLAGKRRRRKRSIEVVSAQGAVLEFELGGDGRWAFVEGSWEDDAGRTQSSRLLRPALRGIARAAKPRHARILATVMQDVDLASAQLIADFGGAVPTGSPTKAPSADSALARAFGLGRDDRKALRAAGSLADLGAGTTLMLAGTSGHDLLFLLDGHVAVDIDGAEVRLGPGSVVGEQAVLTGRPRSATVRSITDVLVIVVPQEAVAGLPVAVRGALGRKIPA